MGTMIEIAPKRDFIALETAYYIVTLRGAKVGWREPDQFHKEKYQDCEFEWEVDVDDAMRERLGLGTDAVVRRSWANLPRTFSEKSKFVQIGVALGALDMTVGAANGAKFDLDGWLGRKCRVNIVEKTKDGEVVADEIKDYQVYQVSRGPAQRRRAATPAPEAPAPGGNGHEGDQGGDNDEDGSIPF